MYRPGPANHGYQAYEDLRVLSADPVELVRILYRAATDEVRKARVHLAAGAIRERSKAITKAIDMLLELSQSLDHTQGSGDLSGKLGRLYDYMIQRLTQANVEQKVRAAGRGPEPARDPAGRLESDRAPAGGHSGWLPGAGGRYATGVGRTASRGGSRVFAAELESLGFVWLVETVV